MDCLGEETCQGPTFFFNAVHCSFGVSMHVAVQCSWTKVAKVVLGRVVAYVWGQGMCCQLFFSL